LETQPSADWYSHYEDEIADGQEVHNFKSAVHGVARGSNDQVLRFAIHELGNAIASFSLEHPDVDMSKLVDMCVYMDDDSYKLYEKYFPRLRESVLSVFRNWQHELFSEISDIQKRVKELLPLLEEDQKNL